MELDVRIKLLVYRQFAETAEAPSVSFVAANVAVAPDDVRASYERLFRSRVLVLEPDGETIRMAPPFSGVPTQHHVRVHDRPQQRYYANCAWDALGIPAALHLPATIRSRCEQSREPLELEVTEDGPVPSSWLFHCAVPAANWWQDIVYT